MFENFPESYQVNKSNLSEYVNKLFMITLQGLKDVNTRIYSTKHASLHLLRSLGYKQHQILQEINLHVLSLFIDIHI